MALVKVTAKWTGFTGAPGYSNFYFHPIAFGDPLPATTDKMFTRVDAFFTSILSLLPPAAKVQVQGDMPLIDPVTGDMTGFVSRASGSLRSGTGAAAGYSAASGAVVTWRTNAVIAGRRLRGRTFIVPTVNVAYGTDGTLQASTQTTLQTAANALFASDPDFTANVWARPQKERVKKDGTVVPARGGDTSPITSASIPSPVAILRSRRD